ncbi:hypothetical protein BDD12DRAFT_904124 [Trichophaea hybrida]|nr:hypothetical protein BDD12DRAFT_904124 [Trichophaea hybrida]
MPAFVGKLYLHDVLVDCGAELTLITLSLAKKILEANPEMSIKYDRSLNIRGVVGKATTKGYFVAELDFGQGVKAKEILYILGENILNTELLLSKLFLASINAMINMRQASQQYKLVQDRVQNCTEPCNTNCLNPQTVPDGPDLYTGTSYGGGFAALCFAYVGWTQAT